MSCIKYHISYTCVPTLSSWTTTPPLTRTDLATPPRAMRTPRFEYFVTPCITEWLLIMHNRKSANTSLRSGSGPGDLFLAIMEIAILPQIFDTNTPLGWSCLVGTPVTVYHRAITPDAEAAARESRLPRGGSRTVLSYVHYTRTIRKYLHTYNTHTRYMRHTGHGDLYTHVHTHTHTHTHTR